MQIVCKYTPHIAIKYILKRAFWAHNAGADYIVHGDARTYLLTYFLLSIYDQNPCAFVYSMVNWTSNFDDNAMTIETLKTIVQTTFRDFMGNN